MSTVETAYRCQHCRSCYEPADWMHHAPTCPHGKIDPERLSLIPSWKLEEELLRRASPRTLTEFLKSGHAAALEQAATLSDCLVILLKLARLTRYVRPTTTMLNVPNGILCDLDRVLAERGVTPVRGDDHAD